MNGSYECTETGLMGKLINTYGRTEISKDNQKKRVHTFFLN